MRAIGLIIFFTAINLAIYYSLMHFNAPHIAYVVIFESLGMALMAKLISDDSTKKG